MIGELIWSLGKQVRYQELFRVGELSYKRTIRKERKENPAVKNSWLFLMEPFEIGL